MLCLSMLGGPGTFRYLLGDGHKWAIRSVQQVPYELGVTMKSLVEVTCW